MVLLRNKLRFSQELKTPIPKILLPIERQTDELSAKCFEADQRGNIVEFNTVIH